jgi:ABC-type Fe3+-hydroxamate transport system substrate-binding protein
MKQIMPNCASRLNAEVTQSGTPKHKTASINAVFARFLSIFVNLSISHPTSTIASPPRIVSLVPSLTELLFAMGLGPWVVGRTGFCIHPAQGVAAVPKVGGTKDVNLDKIQRLGPTHVLVNVDENELPTVEALRACVPRVIVTHPCAPQDNLALIDQISTEFAPYFIANKAINSPANAANALKDQLQQRLQRLQARLPQRHPEQVLYLIWKDPWMTVAQDTYISRMLALVGWQTWPAVQGGAHGAARYPVVGGAEPWLGQIERVLLSSEPYRFSASHIAAAQALCPGAQVQCVDGELLSWYGSRALAGLDYLEALAGGAPIIRQ